jgi:hypothetical protein
MASQNNNYHPQTDVSWICCTCGLPNFSTSLFESLVVDTSNGFDSLSMSMNTTGNTTPPGSDGITRWCELTVVYFRAQPWFCSDNNIWFCRVNKVHETSFLSTYTLQIQWYNSKTVVGFLCTCGLPNFSTSLFESLVVDTSNGFDSLSMSMNTTGNTTHPGYPLHTSSPKREQKSKQESPQLFSNYIIESAEYTC